MNEFFRYIEKLSKELQGTPLFNFLLFLSKCLSIYMLIRKVYITVKKKTTDFPNVLSEIIAKMTRMIQINSTQINKQLQYAHLRITKTQLLDRIGNSDSSALRFNSMIDGAIVGIPVGRVDDKTIFHQFVRENNDFRDLGLCN